LSPYTHLRVALRGASTSAHHDVQLKIGDTSGRVNWILLRSVADLPVWRVVYVDLREMECFAGFEGQCATRPPLDLTHVNRIEIAVSRSTGAADCGDPTSPANSLDVDELAAVDLRPGSPRRVVESAFETVRPSPDVRSSIGEGLLRRIDATHLIPAWMGESQPYYNTYSEAVAILVFTEEWNRTGDVRFRDAARRVAGRMLALQSSDGS